MNEWIKSRYPEPGIFRWIGFSLELISALTLFILTSLTCLDVSGRYFFNNAIDGSVEITRLGLAILVFAQIPLVTWRGEHVVVDLLDSFLNKFIIKILNFISIIIIIISFYFLGSRIFELAARSLRRGEVTEYLAIPMGYIAQYIAFMTWATAGIIITLSLYRLFTHIKNKSIGE